MQPYVLVLFIVFACQACIGTKQEEQPTVAHPGMPALHVSRAEGVQGISGYARTLSREYSVDSFDTLKTMAEAHTQWCESVGDACKLINKTVYDNFGNIQVQVAEDKTKDIDKSLAHINGWQLKNEVASAHLVESEPMFDEQIKIQNEHIASILKILENEQLDMSNRLHALNVLKEERIRLAGLLRQQATMQKQIKWVIIHLSYTVQKGFVSQTLEDFYRACREAFRFLIIGIPWAIVFGCLSAPLLGIGIVSWRRFMKK